MEIIETFLVALVTIFIVDLSGFTESWRTFLARLLHVKALKPLPPFDCGLCMTWWTCIIFTICRGTFSIPMLAFIALLSYLSIPLGMLLIFIKEGIISLLNKMMDKL